MSDKDFIDKLNDIMINYGYIIIDRSNYEYYLDRYNIKNYYKEFFESWCFHRFKLFNIKENMFEIGFNSVNMMINNDHWSIFKYAKRDYDCGEIKIFPIDFVNFIMSIEGNSKEEILLKLQLMGY